MGLLAEAFKTSHQALLDALPIAFIKEIVPQVLIGHPIVQDMVDDGEDAVSHR